MMIMNMAIEEKIDHMDAIVAYCEKNGLEIEVAAALINDSLRSLIEGEAMELRYIPRGSKLPL